MMEITPDDTTEYESFSCPIYLQGAGAAAPTLLSRNNYTVARTSAGVYTVTFTDNPGGGGAGVYLGCGQAGFDDVTAANVAGWSSCVTFTAATATAAAFLKVSIFNGSNAATDLAATSRMHLPVRLSRILKNFSATQPI